MELAGIRRALECLETSAWTAGSLRGVEVPRFGSSEARRTARSLADELADQLEDAELAMGALGVGEDGLQPLRDARRGLRELRDSPRKLPRAGAHARAVAEAAREAVRSSPTVEALYQHGRTAMHDGTIGSSLAAGMLQLVRLTGDDLGRIAPRTELGSLRLGAVLRELSDVTADPSAPRQALRVFAAEAGDDAGAAERLRELLERHPETLRDTEWAELSGWADTAVARRAGLVDVAGAGRAQDALQRAARGEVDDAAIRSVVRWRAEADGSLVDASSVRVAFEQLVRANPASLSRMELIRLGALIDVADPARRLDVPRSAPGARPLDELLATLTARTADDRREHAVVDDLHRYVVRWRDGLDGPVDVDSTRGRFMEIVARDPADIDRAEWIRLRALLDSDSAKELGLARDVQHAAPLEDVMQDVANGWRSDDGDVVRYLTRWRADLDPTWAADRATAYRMALDGQPLPPGARFEEMEVLGLTADRIGADPTGRLRLRLANGSTPIDRSDAAAFLAEVRSITRELGPPPTGSPIEPVWNNAMALIERNEQRLAGMTPDGAVQGYGSHPDYAELGRIRSDLDLVAIIGGGSARSSLHADVLAW